jgi:hypothetical protein
MTKDDVLGAERNFAALSTRDLLEARDLYHWHLIHRANVVGTAVGLYRIRRDDPWPSREKPMKPRRKFRNTNRRASERSRTLRFASIRGLAFLCLWIGGRT